MPSAWYIAIHINLSILFNFQDKKLNPLLAATIYNVIWIMKFGYFIDFALVKNRQSSN